MSGTRREPGQMGPHVEGFRAWLLEAGYTPGTVHNMLKVVGQLGRWMEEEGLETAALTRAVIESFLGARRNAGPRRMSGVRSFEPLLDYLRSQSVLVAETRATTPIEELLAGYQAWLVVERGLAPATVLRYEKLARRFLEGRTASSGPDGVEDLNGSEVTAFLLAESARCSVGTAKGRVAELRSLLRFLHVKGLTPVALASAVPPVAGWRDTSLPRGIAAEEVQRLLDGCGRDDHGGIRDLAMLMLVARLGLRCIEVARFELGDIDWRAGEIVVRGKARRQDRLPLPVDVGEALSAYLCQARPPTAIRQVFLAQKAPRRAIRPDLVSDVCRRACERAGVPQVGAHRLRHSLAAEMLSRGATLVEVSQILRHGDLATTAIYAKVDLGALRVVAQPWPGADR